MTGLLGRIEQKQLSKRFPAIDAGKSDFPVSKLMTVSFPATIARFSPVEINCASSGLVLVAIGEINEVSRADLPHNLSRLTGIKYWVSIKPSGQMSERRYYLTPEKIFSGNGHPVFPEADGVSIDKALQQWDETLRPLREKIAIANEILSPIKALFEQTSPKMLINRITNNGKVTMMHSLTENGIEVREDQTPIVIPYDITLTTIASEAEAEKVIEHVRTARERLSQILFALSLTNIAQRNIVHKKLMMTGQLSLDTGSDDGSTENLEKITKKMQGEKVEIDAGYIHPQTLVYYPVKITYPHDISVLADDKINKAHKKAIEIKIGNNTYGIVPKEERARGIIPLTCTTSFIIDSKNLMAQIALQV